MYVGHHHLKRKRNYNPLNFFTKINVLSNMPRCQKTIYSRTTSSEQIVFITPNNNA
ncbi:hypothetical protein Hanom_Chr15g01385031 [Helianthus anomalus]